MRAALARQNGWVVLAIVVTVVAISAPVYTYRIMTPTDNDYGTHIQFALDLLKRQPVPSYTLAHPAIQVLLIGILWLSRGRVGLWAGLVILQVAAQVLTALVLYGWFGPVMSRWGDARRAFWAVSLTIVAPVMALAPLDGLYYFGYIGLASYHNPTVHLLRPFALVSFLFALRALEVQRSPFWMVVVSAAVIIFSALIKPNYALIILPALALMAGMGILLKMPVDWRMVLIGFVLPACLVLAVQGAITYADGGSIVILPLAVESAYSSYLPIKFLLSVVFPLVALVVYFPQMRRNWMSSESQAMLLAWAAFAAGALQLYLLAESGRRLEHGNFRWSAQIGLFLLFAATARYWLCDQPLFGKIALKRQFPILAGYLLHIGAGIVYYIYALTSRGYG
jgi:hypothetical protein